MSKLKQVVRRLARNRPAQQAKPIVGAWFVRPSEVPPHYVRIRFNKRRSWVSGPPGSRLPDNEIDLLDFAYPEWRVEHFADVLATTGGDLVSKRFRDLIEEFEPEVHQFFPCTLYDVPTVRRTNNQYEYFGLRVAKALPAVDVANSAVTVGGSLRLHMFGGRLKTSTETYIEAIDRVSVIGSVIEGAHLWENQPRAPGYFISDTLKRRINAEDITGLEFCPCYLT